MPDGTRPAPDDPAERAEVERLCNDYFKLAVKIARRWGKMFPWLSDDFESDGGLALLRAARTRHTFGGKFETLVYRHVERACLRLLTKERNRPDSRFNTESMPGEGGHGQGAHEADKAAGIVDDTHAAELVVEVRDLLEQLPAARRSRIVRLFFGGEHWTEIAAELGISPQAVGAAARRDMGKLHKAAEGINNEA